MTVYRAIGSTVPKTAPIEESPRITVSLHLIVENFHKHGRGRKPARKLIEAMLERNYAMVKTGRCDYTLTVSYDRDQEDVSLDDAINDLYAEISDIAESHNCSIDGDVQEIGGEERSW